MELAYIETIESELQALYNRLSYCEQDEQQIIQRAIQTRNLKISRLMPCE
jgi:hypothetical protein